MTENEKQARQEAGRVACGYLDRLGKADALAELSDEEYGNFLDALFETYHERLTALSGGNEAPF